MLSKPLLLIGLRSCGKSTVGRALAEQLQLDFFDSDQVITAHYFAQTGKRLGCEKIHQIIGEVEFRVLETEAIKQLSKINEPAVIATGGSSMLSKKNIALLQNKTFVIYLRANMATLQQRWQKNPPIFINVKALSAELDRYYEQRASLYQSLADICVAVDEQTIDDIVRKIVTAKKLALS